jgi:hypothetical protein
MEWNYREFCHVPQSLAPQHCAPLGRVPPKQISKSIYPPSTDANRCMKKTCGAHSLTLRSVPISFSVGCLLEVGLAKAAGKHFVGTRWPASLLTAIPAAISVFQEVHCYPPCTIARIGTTLLYTDFSVRAQMKYWWLGCLCRFLLTTFLRHIRNSTVDLLSPQFLLPCASARAPPAFLPALQLTPTVGRKLLYYRTRQYKKFKISGSSSFGVKGPVRSRTVPVRAWYYFMRIN